MNGFDVVAVLCLGSIVLLGLINLELKLLK